MPRLTERQRKILLLAVREYIDSAQPVSSRRLVQRYHLDVSSATVRNELAALVEMGYLRQPHTSAGRVPTEDGYRFFVAELLSRVDLPPDEQEEIRQEFLAAQPGLEGWMQIAASVLAQHAQGVSLVTSPHTPQPRYKHMELIATRGRQVLAVLVLTGGEVLQRLLTLPEPVTQARLSQAASELNEHLAGLSYAEIAAAPLFSDALSEDMRRIVLEDMRRAETHRAGEIYLDGLAHILNQPEFSRSEPANRTLKILEERETLRDFLHKAAQESRIGGVQVLIGSLADWDILQQCALVFSRYGVSGQVTGTVGVLGPMRMPYTRAIPAVRYISGVLTNLVNETMLGDVDYE